MVVDYARPLPVRGWRDKVARAFSGGDVQFIVSLVLMAMSLLLALVVWGLVDEIRAQSLLVIAPRFSLDTYDDPQPTRREFLFSLSSACAILLLVAFASGLLAWKCERSLFPRGCIWAIVLLNALAVAANLAHVAYGGL